MCLSSLGRDLAHVAEPLREQLPGVVRAEIRLFHLDTRELVLVLVEVVDLVGMNSDSQRHGRERVVLVVADQFRSLRNGTSSNLASARTSVSRPFRTAGSRATGRRRSTRRSSRGRGRFGRGSNREAPRSTPSAAGSEAPRFGTRQWRGSGATRAGGRARRRRRARARRGSATRIAIFGVRRYGSSTFGSGGRKPPSGRWGWR